MRTGAIVVLILALGISAYLLTQELREAFGTSPGTMVQLQTSHVPTEEDYVFYRDVYPKMVRREITELTDGDPGELRPWIFPWYGRGVSFFA
jgi:hypothetical protein